MIFFLCMRQAQSHFDVQKSLFGQMTLYVYSCADLVNTTALQYDVDALNDAANNSDLSSSLLWHEDLVN